jgi:hypothetical protein
METLADIQRAINRLPSGDREVIAEWLREKALGEDDHVAEAVLRGVPRLSRTEHRCWG